MTVEDGIFLHQCIEPTCDRVVQFDDEPWCYTHSPDEGSSLNGWSARKVLHEEAERLVVKQLEHRRTNVFDPGGS